MYANIYSTVHEPCPTIQALLIVSSFLSHRVGPNIKHYNKETHPASWTYGTVREYQQSILCTISTLYVME